MTSIEDKIKEQCKYEIKKTSKDILEELNRRKVVLNSHPSKNKFNLKSIFGFGTLVTAACAIILVINNNDVLDDEVVPPNNVQVLKNDKVASDLMSTMEIVNLIDLDKINNLVTLSSDTITPTDPKTAAQDLFELGFPAVDNYYSGIVKNEIVEEEYIGIYGNYHYKMNIDDKYTFYFNNRLDGYDSYDQTKNKISGEIIDGEDIFRVSAEKKFSVGIIRTLFTIFLNNDDSNSLIVYINNTTSDYDYHYSYRLSANRKRIIDIEFHSSEEPLKSTLKVTNKSYNSDDSINEFDYEIEKVEELYNVSYTSTNSSSINGSLSLTYDNGLNYIM